MPELDSKKPVIFGEGALTELPAILDQLAAQKVLLIADSAAYSASGAAERLGDCLQARQTVRFSNFELNPKFADVLRGIDVFRDLRPDIVIGLGGGTAIDLAKLIDAFACQRAPAGELIAGEAAIAHEGVPLIAVPTTAGTGSEATHFAVVYREGQKFSVAHPTLLPDFAIIDPLLTYSMPKSVAAATGLDALCQAIESIWAVGATEQSIGHATSALELALANLESAVLRPTPASRRFMSEAAHLSGKAINISKTTAPHALSYWLTMQYGIPHGIAVALFIGPMLQYNADVSTADCIDPRGPEHVRERIATVLRLLNVTDATAGRAKIEWLIGALGCPVSLREIGLVGDGAMKQLVERANAERMSNNPRRIDPTTFARL
jgi:alcohol dehydrogenase class IV